MERARFNKRSQKPGESVETFIQDLYRLADNCNYGALRDDLIRDRIVVGVLDDSLSDRPQSKGTLTLTQAVQMSCQAESRAQNCDIIRGTTNQLRSNLLTQESQEIKNHQAKKTPNLPKAVDGVATKDTPAKHDLRKMLPVTNAKKKDTFKLFVAALHCQQRKYGNWKKMKSRKREMRFCFSEKFRPQGAVGLCNSGLTAKILAPSWTLVLQSQSLVQIPHG